MIGSDLHFLTVIPAKAGIQLSLGLVFDAKLGPCLRRGDDHIFIRV